MDTRKLFMFASGGIVFGVLGIFIYSDNIKHQDPLGVSYNPYKQGIYASGIVESLQENGSNTNMFPSVAGRITAIHVKDGSRIKKGEVLLTIDPAAQTGIVETDKATVKLNEDSLVTVQDQYNKLLKAYTLNPKAVSKNDLDNAKNAVITATQNITVSKAKLSADQALLDEFTVIAPSDGIILRVSGTVGDYVSPGLGVYDPYIQGTLPIIQIGQASQEYQVRVYVDEILVPQLPNPTQLEAKMFIRGMKNVGFPITYVNMQPYTIPNIQLSDQRQERVDVRVLPIVFKFEKPKDLNIFPGQLVDVFIKSNREKS